MRPRSAHRLVCVTVPPRLVAAVLVGVEGAALAGLAIAELVTVITEGPLSGVPVVVFFATCSAAVLWSVRGLVRGESWSRGPLVAVQLLLLALSWSYHRPYPVPSYVAAGMAAVVLAALLLPSTTRALSGRDDAASA